MASANRNLHPLFRLVALLLVTIAVAWFVHYSDAKALARIESTPPDAYLQYQRHIHGHSYLYHYIAFLIGGGLYLGIVEMIIYLLQFVISADKTDA